MSKNIGKIAQVIGPVVDIKFDSSVADLPNIYDALEITKKNGSKVIISGIGGDEFFSGYPSFERIPKINTLLKSFPKKDFIAQN